MQDVCIAMLPACVAGVLFFGYRSAIILALSVAAAVLSEWFYCKASHSKSTIGDFSAVVTGMLLAMNLPSTVPYWMPVIGSVIAIILVKQIFGGIGQNIFNPALMARAILFISWGTIMASYPQATPGEWMVGMAGGAADTISSATPLSAVGTGNYSMLNLFLGNVPGVLGETSKAALLLGGLYLLVRKVIDWRIPVSFIATAFICYLLKDGAEVALYQILSGGLFIGAFFMATDYATSPYTPWGKIVMGIGCGLLLFVIRAFANYPEGCSFAILFMNMATPLIEKFTMPRSFGEVKQHG